MATKRQRLSKKFSKSKKNAIKLLTTLKKGVTNVMGRLRNTLIHRKNAGKRIRKSASIKRRK